jgi:FG-GAP-like repeat/Divergent InlB B-repeat domain
MKTILSLINQAATGCALYSRLMTSSATAIAIAAFGLASTATDLSAQTAFYYSSPVGERVGGGRTRTFTAPVDAIIASVADVNRVFVTISEGDSGSGSKEFFGVTLAAPVGQPLTAGLYEGATNPFFDSTNPGIFVYGNFGGVCNRTKGRFNILAITIAADGTIASLAANFSQQCEGATLPLVGEIRINSSIPLTTATVGVDTSPDPFAFLMQSPVESGATVTSLATMVYGVNAPTPISIVDGEYKVNDGAYTSVSSTVQNTDLITVRATASLIAGGTVAPRLTIGDREVSTLVTTYRPGTRLSGVRLVSAPGDNVGNGVRRLFLAPLDIPRAYEGSAISIVTTGRSGERWSINVSPPAGNSFVVGQYYENVKRYPFNNESPGLEVTTNNGSCGQVFGRFIIHELTKDTNGVITSLAIDLEQRCDSNTKPPLVGEVRINSSIPFTSLPSDIRYGVTVNKVGRGSGAVTSASGELSCGLACTVYLPEGWSLSVSAAATPGSIFRGWEDATFPICAGLLPCSFQVTSGKLLTARFEVPTKLTVIQTGSGFGSVNSNQINGAQINCPTTCSADFDLDTTIVLNASAGFGSVFTGWSGGGCSGESTCTVTMNAAKTVQANFVLGYVLSVTTDQVYGAGKVISAPAGIDCGTACRAVVSPGGSVTLTAVPNVGSLFVGWSGDSCSGTAPCIVAMNQPRNVKAAFVVAPRRISVSRTGTGDGVVTSTNGTIVCGNTCDASFSPAVGIELVAIPVQGSAFVGWSGGCTGSGNCIIAQNKDIAVAAIFNRAKSTLGRTNDFNNDGKSDLVVQTATGSTNIWQMSGASISSASLILANQPDWTVSHMGDFNGDGKADILWRNANGAVTIWLMDGSIVLASAGLIGPDGNWRVSDIADFNGDGKADILWRNSNGAVTMWLMDGITIASTAGVLGADANWRVSHVGDFNGDGKADLLWRNINGAVTMWLMNGTAISSTAGILGADPNWSVSHVADFNGDGKADILWRSTTGAVTSWLMDGTTVANTAGLLGPDPTWSVTHTADFNGDGKSDLLWRNINGAVTMWLMNGNAVASTGGLIGPDANWRVSHTADYDGDGKSDLLWLNVNSSLTVWTMNGLTATNKNGIAGPTAFRVVP